MLTTIQTQSFNDWNFCNEIDLIIADPPFSINFTGKPSNYNRKDKLVVDGYVEWKKEDFPYYIEQLLISAEQYLNPTGSLLLFSGWQISPLISYVYHNKYIKSNLDLHLQGKLYWNYNFAPACKKRPNHNVYEIFWFTKDPFNWTYNNRCSQRHCTNGEANLCTFQIKREYFKGIPKYPTRFPSELVKTLVEHFSKSNHKILDPLCGSGIVGIIGLLYYPDQTFFLGDLNPHSHTVYQALYYYFKQKINTNHQSLLNHLEGEITNK